MTELAMQPSGSARLRWDRWLAVVVLAAMGIVAVLSFLQAERVAAGHAYFHLLFALIGAIPALLLAMRSRPSAGTLAATVGLELLALAQLVEALGAWGFGPDNDTVVSGLKAFHDLGLAITPIGLIGAVVGPAIGIGAALRHRVGLPVAIAVVVVALGGGLFVVAKLIGIG